jgi:hypothetical protein
VDCDDFAWNVSKVKSPTVLLAGVLAEHLPLMFKSEYTDNEYHLMHRT